MKLGIYGGTFNPIHFGHLILAERAREELELDEVWFIPAQRNPHRQGESCAPPEHRLEMVRQAIADNPQFQASSLEIERPGLSYTIDTLQQVHAERPDAELFLLMGADTVADFPNWHRPQEILTLATLVAVNRGSAISDPAPILDLMPNDLEERFQAVPMPAVEISATNIRERIAHGSSVRYLTPATVVAYVVRHDLYRP